MNKILNDYGGDMIKVKSFLRKVFVVFITVSVFLSTTQLPVKAAGEMNIVERLGITDPTFSIIDTFDIKFIDDSGNEIVGDPTINTKARITINWSILDEYVYLGRPSDTSPYIKAGDFYTFTLPDTFKILNQLSGSLSEYGSFVINPDRTVQMTFNDEVEKQGDINGIITFDARLDEAKITQPGEYEVLTPINGGGTFTLNVDPINKETGISKKVYATEARSDGKNPKSITWEVQINKAYEDLSNVVVTDVLPVTPNDSLELSGIEVYLLNLNNDGTFNSYSASPLSPGTDYTVVGSQVNLGDINQPYAIRYKTNIKDSFKPDGGGTITIVNNAEMSATNTTLLTASASFSAIYGRLLEKTRTGYNPVTQTFTWNVRYNDGEKALVTPLVTDVFSANMEYVDGTTPISIVDLAGNTLVLGTDYTFVSTPADNKIEIQFIGTLNKAVDIKYNTKIKDSVIISGPTDVTVSNTVTSNGQSSGTTGTATQMVLVKDTSSINYSTKKIGWSVYININEYDIKDFTLTDTYVNQGLTFDSIIVRDITLGTVVDPSNYTFTKTFDGSIETGFTLTFIGSYAQTSNYLRADIVTNYDFNTKLTASPNNRFINSARLNWTDSDDIPRIDTTSANRDVNEETLRNGQKSGNYNAITKEITWTVRVNYNNDPYETPRLEDTIQAGQVFVPGSLEIYEYIVNANGTMSKIGNALDLALFDNLVYPDESNGFKLGIDLPIDSGKRYQIEFKTTLENQLIVASYANEAVFSNGALRHSLPASVSVANGGKFVTKSGSQAGSLIKWSIAINEAQSWIQNATIVDIPSTNQILLEETFNLYPTNINANGTYTINRTNPLIRGTDYTLTINTNSTTGAQTFTLVFINDIRRTYILEYDSQISTTPSNLSITNEVALNGNGVTFEDNGGDAQLVINIDSAGGSAVGTKGSLRIRKMDEDGTTPLQGVRFELSNTFGRKVADLTTDEEGYITFPNLVYANYILKEKSTLEGYVISDQLFTGLPVTVNAASSDQNAVTVLTNLKNKLTINKYDINNELVLGAEFRLERYIGDQWFVVENNLVLNTGASTLEGLESGRYRLIETKASEGFILNSQNLEFEVKTNPNGQEMDMTVNFYNYKGSVELTKYDAELNVLEGVVFDLYDSEDVLYLGDLESDEEGKIRIDELAPGAYYFVEKRSVNGNIVNQSHIPFNVPTVYQGVPNVIELSTMNGKASVSFVKKDETDRALSNVLFGLYKLDGSTEVVLSENIFSNSEGVVQYGSLTPGNYYFKEIQSNEGFILNTKLIEFNVPEAAQTENLEIVLDDFINYKGTIQVTKTDHLGNKIREAEFELRKDTGELIGVYVTSQGQFIVEDVDVGTYHLIEIKAPNGYRGDKVPIVVTIPKEYEGEPVLISVDKINYPIPEYIPDTGVDTEKQLYFSVGLILLGFVFMIIGRKKKRSVKIS